MGIIPVVDALAVRSYLFLKINPYFLFVAVHPLFDSLILKNSRGPRTG